MFSSIMHFYFSFNLKYFVIFLDTTLWLMSYLQFFFNFQISGDFSDLFLISKLFTIREHILYDLDSVKFAKGLCNGSESDFFEYSICPLKKFTLCHCWMSCLINVSYVSWLIILFRSFLSLLILGLLDLYYKRIAEVTMYNCGLFYFLVLQSVLTAFAFWSSVV